jgi:AmmeMemoRadiSam system protein B
MIRRAAVAGSWYPARPPALAAAVEDCLATTERDLEGELIALVAPHAGLIYSGPVAAHAYRLLRDRSIDTVVIVGPSHFAGFAGVSVYPSGAFETPLGPALIDEACAAALTAASPIIRENTAVHGREHSLEMQLPFVKHLAPMARIVPLMMGVQDAGTTTALGDALAAVLRSRPGTLLIASTDLSHYHDAATAAGLDAVVIDCLARFDADGLQTALDQHPGHACGGGPTVAVMHAARLLGARHGVALHYADSGDVSGDKSAVVGYVAAAFGNFTGGHDLPG